MTMTEQAVKSCSKCGQVKPLEDFHRTRRSPGGYRPDCKSCNVARAEAHNAAYAELGRRHADEFEAIYATEKAKRGLS